MAAYTVADFEEYVFADFVGLMIIQAPFLFFLVLMRQMPIPEARVLLVQNIGRRPLTLQQNSWVSSRAGSLQRQAEILLLIKFLKLGRNAIFVENRLFLLFLQRLLTYLIRIRKRRRFLFILILEGLPEKILFPVFSAEVRERFAIAH